MPSRRPEGPIAVGVDLGGTWLRAVAVTLDGIRLRSFRARVPDSETLPGFLRGLWRRWRVTPAKVAALVIATRGVWTASERRARERSLEGLARRVKVVPDAHAAYLAALGPVAGLLVLAGTGSIVLGRTSRGRWVRRGGLGPLLGDEGSAFWIGREWLRARMRGDDFGRVRRLIGAADAPARIAGVAVQVLARARTGDRIARRIVAQAQRYLATQAAEAARTLALPPPVPVSWAGRLLEDPGFRAGVVRELRRRGPSVRSVPPRSSPVEAAARLALRLARGQSRTAF